MIRIKHFYTLILVPLLALTLQAQQPTPIAKSLKVDFDFSGRKLAEVNDPNYHSWPITNENLIEKTFGNLTVSIQGDFKSNWHKLGVSAPYYNKLGSDGLVSQDALTLTISGLSKGNHSLLTYHNILDKIVDGVSPEIKIYINDMYKMSIKPTKRALTKETIETAYLDFEVGANEDVVVRFEINENRKDSPISTAHQIVINGFEIDTPNIKKQATSPYPKLGDEHVEIEKEVTLEWQSAKDVKAHQVYFGEDREAVLNADISAQEFLENTTKNQVTVKGLYSAKRYYWRVDELGASGEVTKGRLWWFKPAHLAFPGAAGYGRFAIGGRGGKVVEVTNLNDDGPGSFRHAVTQDIGPRTIVFHVSGTIELKSRLVINQPYITIAGQTAPGSGITITRAPVGLTGNDGILRFLTIRIGSGTTYDGMGLTGANHSIIDHCSISWTIDESFSSRGARNISLQRTLISEALNVAGHNKYKAGNRHGYAATIGGDIGSFHHNLLAHNYGRNWSMGGGLDGEGFYAGRLDIRNNVVYNWGHRTTDGGAYEVNFVNNYYKPGPSSDIFVALTADHEGVGKGSQRYFFSGNVMPGYFDVDTQEKGRRSRIRNNEIVDYNTFVDRPFFEAYVETQTAKAAYKNVLSDVGSNQPITSEIDERIIEETLQGTYSFKGSQTSLPGMIDTETDAGGFPLIPIKRRDENWDTDHDGLPNWWELAHELNPNSGAHDFSDSNLDEDKDGYTQLEHYLHWMATPHFFIVLNQTLALDVNTYFKGFEQNPKFSCLNVENGYVEIKKNKLQFKPKNKGFGSFELKVTDKDGDSMMRRFNVFIK